MNDNTPVLMDQQPGILELLNRGHERFLDCSHLTLEEAEQIGDVIATIVRDSRFWMGDPARYCKARWPDTHHQVWPVFASPGDLDRTSGVCRAYPNFEDRRHAANYAQYMQNAGKPDRQKRLAEIVDKGQTTDESREALKTEKPSKPGRMLLAIDCNLFLVRSFKSGSEIEAASEVAAWIDRTAKRMREDLGS